MTTSERPALRKLGRLLGRGAFAVSTGATLLVGSLLMAQHMIALPKPALAALPRERPAADGRLSVTHVLMESCGCSQQVLQHLLERRARPEVHERILFIGSDAIAERARAAGYSFRSLSAEQLKAGYGIESSPLMIIVDSAVRVRYLGGYTSVKRGPDIRDLDLIGEVERGESPAGLPVFGCAVSRELQRAIDPLGLKY